MRQPESYTCDACALVRGPGNHWILHFPGDDKKSPLFTEWNNEEAIISGHVCGRGCASKLLDRWFQTHHGLVSEDL